MKKIITAVCALIIAVAAGVALADLNYTQGSGTIIFDFLCFGTKHCSAHVPIDSTGTEKATTANPWTIDTGTSGNLINAIKGSVAAGTNTIGNTVPAAASGFGATPGHVLTIASNNSSNIKSSAGTLYTLTIVQTTTTLGDLRLYDTSSAPTCSSATGVVANYAIQSNTVSPGLSINFGSVGMSFANGISFCLTGAVADNDNTSFVTGVQINYTYK